MLVPNTLGFRLLVGRWILQRREIDRFVSDLVRWTWNALDAPEEFASRLTKLHAALGEHFATEEKLGNQIADLGGEPSIDFEAVCRRSRQEHAGLLKRLNDLVHRLQDTSNPQRWDGAIHLFDLFSDALEQHDDQELASIRWLMASPDKNDQPWGIYEDVTA